LERASECRVPGELTREGTDCTIAGGLVERISGKVFGITLIQQQGVFSKRSRRRMRKEEPITFLRGTEGEVLLLKEPNSNNQLKEELAVGGKGKYIIIPFKEQKDHVEMIILKRVLWPKREVERKSRSERGGDSRISLNGIYQENNNLFYYRNVSTCPSIC